jgi:hypothetical protein
MLIEAVFGDIDNVSYFVMVDLPINKWLIMI